MWRIESARIVGALARTTGDFALAEDLAQEALAEALVTWPRDGVPANPVGWLLTVGRRRAIDAYRRRSALDARYAALARDLGEGGAATGAPPASLGPATADDVLFDPDRIDDDVLALLFTACHPLLSADARVALTLRVVAGLTSDQIARAFLVPTATVQARISRAKRTLSAAQVRFEVPPPDERRARLGSVLSVVYVVFTEGSSATSGDELLRPDLAHEAVRLARIVAHLVPDEAEVHGLLALLELTAARFPARTGPDGDAVLLADQDRRRWDRQRSDGAGPRWRRPAASVGASARTACRRRSPSATRSPPSVETTDWERIVVLYEALGRLAPSPVVDLEPGGRAVDGAGPAAALAVVDDLLAAGQLSGSHLLPSVRGELLARLGRIPEARAELTRAVERCGNARERTVLERKLDDLA